MFEPLIKLVVSKLDPLLDLYVERQRIIVMVAVPLVLLFMKACPRLRPATRRA